jgi:hypothetical protein
MVGTFGNTHTLHLKRALAEIDRAIVQLDARGNLIGFRRDRREAVFSFRE